MTDYLAEIRKIILLLAWITMSLFAFAGKVELTWFTIVTYVLVTLATVASFTSAKKE